MRNPQAKNPRIYYGWYIVATSIFIAFVSVGARQSFGVFVLPMSQEFDWSRGTISLAASLGFLVNGVTQPIMGGLFDRLGGRKVILSSLAIIGLATVLLSLTFHLLFLVFIFGVVTSIALSGSSLSTTGALLSKWFQRRRATVIGLNASGASLGGLILVPFSMYLLQATNWRISWAVLGMLVLVVAIPLGFFFLRDDPFQMGLLPDGDPEPINPENSEGDSPAKSRGPLEVDQWSQSLRSLPIWQLSAAYFVCGATTSMLGVHFVPYAIGEGISPTIAASAFGFMMALNMVGGIGAGMLSDRFSSKNLLALVYFLRGCAYILLLTIPGTASLWAFATVAGFSWIATVPLTTSLTADVYGLRALGTISGISFLCHQLGGALSTLLAGYLFDLTGSYTLPFAIVGGLLFPAALSAFTIKERKYSMRYAVQQAAVGTGG